MSRNSFPDDVIERVMAKLNERQKQIMELRRENIDAWDIAESILGYPGRMLSGSKRAPKGQTIIWNANICTKEHGKIWYGDFNLTKESDKLAELAELLNTTVYLLYESDARFDNELNPRFDRAVFSVDEYGKESWNA